MPSAAAAPRKLVRKRDSAGTTPTLRRRAPSDPSSGVTPSAAPNRQQLASPSAAIGSAAPTSATQPPRTHLRSQTVHSSILEHDDANKPQQPFHRFSLREKPSSELLGQRWDSAAILNNFETILQQPGPSALPPLPHQHSDLTAARPTHPTTARANNIVANPDVRLSESLAATGRRMEDISQPRGPTGSRNPALRLSDEAKDNKVLKKKSGFSKFMNDLVGSPRRPAISAPENPVHVTHVGYDQETGEFTVCRPVGLRRWMVADICWTCGKSRTAYDICTDARIF